jgi:transposase
VQREQVILFPDRLDDYVCEENHVRFMDKFVNSFYLKGLGFKRVAREETGRPPYDPSDLLKLRLYGYLNHARSIRKAINDRLYALSAAKAEVTLSRR